MMNFDFGANLRALRNGKGLTQEQAAELLNVSKQSVSRWETGITWPDIAFLPQLASFYGVSVDSLLGADGPVRQAGASGDPGKIPGGTSGGPSPWGYRRRL